MSMLPTTAKTRPTIAVIGSGIAGLSAAWLLRNQYDITLYEHAARLGGHSNTVEVNYDDEVIAVDTGFIVFNHATYPNLKALFAHLHVPTQASNMSFGVSIGGTMEYASHGLRSVFANPAQLFSPAYWRMLCDILRFNRTAPSLLTQESSITLGEYLDELRMGAMFREYYLLPMAAAIWSCSPDTMLAYPAKTFVRFFSNHGLLSVTQQPQWYTVTGGSREYVRRMTADLQENIRLNTGVKFVCNEGKKVAITLENGNIELYDHVIIATHGDQAYRLLPKPTAKETAALSAFTYQKNRAVLHRDTSLMPRRKAAWASWVYLRDKNKAAQNHSVAVTYWMNHLQHINPVKPLFVTLNPAREPESTKIFAQFEYDHPVFNQAAIDAQARLPAIQGARNIWFCGSYHRYGFHEDALASAINVANLLGVKAPWQS